MLKISMLGLFVEEQAFVRQWLTKDLADYDLSWVSPKNESIEILIVNANFLDSKSLVNFIQELSDNVKILSIATSEDGVKKSQRLNIPSLILPNDNQAELDDWLGVLTSHIQYLRQASTKSRNDDYASKLIKLILVDKAKLKATAETDDTFYLNADENRLFYAKQSSQNAKFALTDFKFHRWDNDDEMNPNIYKYSLNLELWLWTIVWDHPFDVEFMPDQQFTLKKWPEFLQQIKQNRTELITLISLMQRGTISYRSLREYSQFDSEIIDRALYKMHLFHYVEVSLVPQSEGMAETKKRSKSQNKGLFGFINKLREVVGI